MRLSKVSAFFVGIGLSLCIFSQTSGAEEYKFSKWENTIRETAALLRRLSVVPNRPIPASVSPFKDKHKAITVKRHREDGISETLLLGFAIASKEITPPTGAKTEISVGTFRTTAGATLMQQQPMPSESVPLKTIVVSENVEIAGQQVHHRKKIESVPRIGTSPEIDVVLDFVAAVFVPGINLDSSRHDGKVAKSIWKIDRPRLEVFPLANVASGLRVGNSTYRSAIRGVTGCELASSKPPYCFFVDLDEERSVIFDDPSGLAEAKLTLVGYSLVDVDSLIIQAYGAVIDTETKVGAKTFTNRYLVSIF